jgi:hypothetical protein
MKSMPYKTGIGFLAVITAMLLTVACATATKQAPAENVQCTAKTIDWEVTPDVSIDKFSCALGKHGTDPALIFTVTLRNTTQTPHRYRVNIFLDDMGKAAGYFVPRKGKPPRIAAGAEKTIKIPFLKTTAMSDDILVIVKTAN